MKQFVVTALALFLMSMPVFGQDTTGQSATTTNSSTRNGQTYQPDVRGSLLFAVGVNVLSNAPEVFEISTWGSKSVNLYYLYDINIGTSSFSFHPGFGLGLEKYDMEGSLTLGYLTNAPGVPGAEPVVVIDSLQNVFAPGLYKKNRLAANYLDIPLEISWVSNKLNPKAGFKVTAGGKVGVLFGSHTKVKYTVGNETRKDKLKRDYNLNPFRYSAHARVGYSSFNLYFEYQLSSLFDAGDAPLYRTTRDTGSTLAPYNTRLADDLGNWRIGLAVDLF